MTAKAGLILVNLGSPDAPTAAAVRPYLGEFLHDYRVIETSRWIWCPILHGIILRVRPAKSARAYTKIWNFDGAGDENSEAPLIRITRGQAKAVQTELGDEVVVDIAMRYGNPSIGSALDRMIAKEITRIAVLPMYPQYAGATTGSVYDGFSNALKTRRTVPSLRILRDYHTHPEYIAALAASINEKINQQSWQPDVILASYHGMPQAYIDRGDPYADECEATTDLLRSKLNLPKSKLRLTFQSRFGPKQWLQPYTDQVLQALVTEGKKSVTILTPGFSADCLETLEEINMEARKTFIDAGGTNFSFVPCLNTRPDHIGFLVKLAKEELLSGWL